MRSLLVIALLGLQTLAFGQYPNFIELDQLKRDTVETSVVLTIPWGNMDVPNLFVTIPLVQSDAFSALELRALYYSNVQLSSIKEQLNKGVGYLRNWWKLDSAQAVTINRDLSYTLRVPLTEPVSRQVMIKHIVALCSERTMTWNDSNAVMLKRH